MTDTLTPTQTLLVWCLLAKQGVAKQADIMPVVKAADRKALEVLKFVTVATRSRSLWITLEDKGWGWANDHLRDPVPPAFRVLQDFLGRLHDNLENARTTLADFIGEASSPPLETRKDGPAKKSPKTVKNSNTARTSKTRSKAAKLEQLDVSEEIERAYLKVTKNVKGADAKLSAVRRHLSKLDRAAVDEAFATMAKTGGKARLMKVNDKRAVTKVDQDAAVVVAGETFHILWIMP
ncbi:hypothetical protein [Beijerinckia sp. L45]|uniref:hypothetical protein n=1 Tax=Beijerinckia sp. L45 TaxID=1641855 RepID=UPI00131BB0DC|nr:hypothetical protein [Beijerinckia sp. L45]